MVPDIVRIIIRSDSYISDSPSDTLGESLEQLIESLSSRNTLIL